MQIIYIEVLIQMIMYRKELEDMADMMVQPGMPEASPYEFIF